MIQPQRWMRPATVVLNVAIALLAVGVFAKATIRKHEGALLTSLPSSPTLVIAMSTECHWCTRSAQTIKRLVAASTRRGRYGVVAVFPQPVSTSREYLAGLGLDIPDVRQVDFRRASIVATPTFLVIKEHAVTRKWLGLLTVEDEAAVLATLLRRQDMPFAESRPSQADDAAVGRDASQAAAMIASGTEVIDVRSREDYGAGHIAGALNIPIDELDARGKHEVTLGVPVVLYCGCADCKSTRSNADAQRQCGLATERVLRAGASRVVAIDQSLETCERAGIPLFNR